jgi:hypothetical protein
MKTSDVIITWLGEHEDFEGAPTEPLLRAAENLAETTEIEVSASAADVPTEPVDTASGERR